MNLRCFTVSKKSSLALEFPSLILIRTSLDELFNPFKIVLGWYLDTRIAALLPDAV